MPFSLGALIVPEEEGLSEGEKAAIEIFEKNGGKTFYYDKYLDSFKPADFEKRWYEAYEIADTYGRKIATTGDKKVDLKFLEDEYEYAIVAIDFAEEARTIEGLEIRLCAETGGENCLFVCGEREMSLPVVSCGEDKKIVIPEFVNGGVIFIGKR